MLIEVCPVAVIRPIGLRACSAALAPRFQGAKKNRPRERRAVLRLEQRVQRAVCR
jgi:hypothetical protein